MVFTPEERRLRKNAGNKRWREKRPNYHKNYYHKRRKYLIVKSRKRYAENKEKILIQQREHYNLRPEIAANYRAKNRISLRKKLKKWQKKHPEAARKNSKTQRQRYPDKCRARMRVSYAIQMGRLAKPTLLLCEKCKKPAREYHHYLGYVPEHWYDVIALCKSCHVKVDHGGF